MYKYNNKEVEDFNFLSKKVYGSNIKQRILKLVLVLDSAKAFMRARELSALCAEHSTMCTRVWIWASGRQWQNSLNLRDEDLKLISRITVQRTTLFLQMNKYKIK